MNSEATKDYGPRSDWTEADYDRYIERMRKKGKELQAQKDALMAEMREKFGDEIDEADEVTAKDICDAVDAMFDDDE